MIKPSVFLLTLRRTIVLCKRIFQAKDTIIGDILDIAPETAPIFLSIGMHCLGCPSSRGETVEQACMVHGVQVDELLERINASMAEAK